VKSEVLLVVTGYVDTVCEVTEAVIDIRHSSECFTFNWLQ